MPLTRLLTTICRAHPDRPALISGAGSLSFGALLRRVDGIAGALRGRGVQRGDAVGVCLPRSVDSVVAVLGIMRAGGVYVPVDPAYPPDRQAMIAADAGLRAAVVGRAPAWAPEVPLIRADSGQEESGEDSGQEEAGEKDSGEDRLNILYTSGSTGRPKGVIGSRAAMLNRLEWGWSAFPSGAGEVVTHRSSLNFVDAGPEIFSGLLRGVPTLVVLPEEHADLDRMARALQAGGATRLTVVPSLLAAMLRLPGAAERLAGVRVWISSGEALSLPLLRRFREVLPGATLINLYGTTEVTGDATAAVFAPGSPLPEAAPPIGAAIASAELLVLDGEGRPVAEGAEGELHIGGPVLALGYHRRPAEEALRFPPHPSRRGARVFRTGDRVRRLPDGQLEFRGRTDTAVKIRGIRADLEEIGRCLEENCPEAAAIAVVLAEDGPVALAVPVAMTVRLPPLRPRGGGRGGQVEGGPLSSLRPRGGEGGPEVEGGPLSSLRPRGGEGGPQGRMRGGSAPRGPARGAAAPLSPSRGEGTIRGRIQGTIRTVHLPSLRLPSLRLPSLRSSSDPAPRLIAQVRAAAARWLPEAMRPVRVAVLERLPLLPNGKLDRPALTALARAAARTVPEAMRPQGATELRLAALWARVLLRDDISRADRFSDLGGDSLKLAELLGLVREAFGAAADRPDPLFLYDGTLAEVAARLDGLTPTIHPAAAGAGAITIGPLAAAADDPEAIRMISEASFDGAILASTGLPARMDAAAAAAWCRSQDGALIRLDGRPAGAGTVQSPPDTGIGVEAPPGSAQLEEWLHPAFRGTGLLGAGRAWPLLAAWLAARFDFEVSVVWEDHAAMLAILQERGYRCLGRSHWINPDPEGVSGGCEVWICDLAPYRAAP